MGLDGDMNASLELLDKKDMDTMSIIDGINNNISMIQPPDRGDGDVTNMNNSVVDLIESQPLLSRQSMQVIEEQ